MTQLALSKSWRVWAWDCRWSRDFDASTLARSKRRFGHPVALESQACLFQVELALDVAARFIGDLALLQHPVDVCALGGDELSAQIGGSCHGGAPAGLFRHLPCAMVVTQA